MQFRYWWLCAHTHPLRFEVDADLGEAGRAAGLVGLPASALIVNWYDIKVSAQPFEAAIR